MLMTEARDVCALSQSREAYVTTEPLRFYPKRLQNWPPAPCPEGIATARQSVIVSLFSLFFVSFFLFLFSFPFFFFFFFSEMWFFLFFSVGL